MTEAVSAQAQDEARRTLADEMASAISYALLARADRSDDGSFRLTFSNTQWKLMVDALCALRADPARGAEEMRERAAKAAEADRSVDDCPYSNDKPGDPTWHHTDDDVCPRCRKIGKDSGSACVGVAKHRIAAAIRALPASGEGGGDG